MKFKNIVKIALALLCLTSSNLFAQQSDITIQNKADYKLHKKNSFFINWGYNRCWFNKSDIHFSGQGHDFVLYDVKAYDRPSDLSLDYIKPNSWSIPQFDFTFGYLLSDKYSISISWDHMKYVAQDYQTVKMYGYLDPTFVSDPLMKTNMEIINMRYATPGLYNDIPVEMTPLDFIHIEHTDGLNYANIDMERYDKLWQSANYNKFGISLVTGIGTGLIIPRTDAHLFGSGENHFWNIAGWGTNAKIGLQINVTKHIYLQSDFKYGYLQMTNIHSSNHYGVDKAQQHIVFYENYWQIGFKF